MTAARTAPLLAALALSCATAPKPAPAPAPAPAKPAVDPAAATVPPAGASAPQAAPTAAPAAEAGPSPYLWPDVVQLRSQARDLLREQSDLYWKNWVFGTPLDLASTYQGKDALFSQTSVEAVRRAREAATGDAKRALQMFELYLAGEVIAKSTAPLADDIANIETSATIAIDGTHAAYRDLDRLIAGEANADRRAKLYAAELPVLDKLDPLIKQKIERTEQAVQQLGYASYAAFGAALRDADLEQLAKLGQRTLEETDTLYARAMERVTIDELALPLAKVRRSDIPRLFRGVKSEQAFPASKLLPLARRTFAGLGVDLDTQKGLLLHTEALPKKNPRAVCFPVEVPTDVRVSVKPTGGAEDYRSLFHELGHAEHFLHVTRPEWEFQQLGNNTVTEAYAFLMEGLIDTPAWLEANVGMKGDDLQRFVRASAAKKLYMLRRYAAKVQFEALWHAGKLAEKPADAYRRLLSRAYGFELTSDDARRYLTDHDDFFYSADYFRAWFLAGQIERQLVARFGTTWWESKQAGEFLQTLWAEGNRPTADELARKVGAAGLDPSALAKTLGERLGVK